MAVYAVHSSVECVNFPRSSNWLVNMLGNILGCIVSEYVGKYLGVIQCFVVPSHISIFPMVASQTSINVSACKRTIKPCFMLSITKNIPNTDHLQ